MNMMDLPPPVQNFNRPAHVFQLADDAPEIGVRQNFQRAPNQNTNFVRSVSNPDTLPDDPLTAREAVEKLYDKSYLRDQSRKEDLIDQLHSLELEDQAYPRQYYDVVKELVEKRILSQESFAKLIYELGPVLTLQATKLILKDSADVEKSKLIKQAETLVQVLDQISEDDLADLISV
jgi:hypothetical protein